MGDVRIQASAPYGVTIVGGAPYPDCLWRHEEPAVAVAARPGGSRAAVCLARRPDAGWRLFLEPGGAAAAAALPDDPPWGAFRLLIALLDPPGGWDVIIRPAPALTTPVSGEPDHAALLALAGALNCLRPPLPMAGLLEAVCRVQCAAAGPPADLAALWAAALGGAWSLRPSCAGAGTAPDPAPAQPHPIDTPVAPGPLPPASLMGRPVRLMPPGSRVSAPAGEVAAGAPIPAPLDPVGLTVILR